MGFLANLFKKPDPPEPYDWAELRVACLRAIAANAAGDSLAGSELGQLEEDRLGATGDDAEEVVVEVWMAVANDEKPPLSSAQTTEYLLRATQILKENIDQHEAARRLKAVEQDLLAKWPEVLIY